MNLTPKQETVMNYKSQGLTNKQIAEKLNLSEPAIQMRVNSAVKALGAVNAMHGVSIYVSKKISAGLGKGKHKNNDPLTVLQILAHIEVQIAELGLEPLAAAKRAEILGTQDMDEFLYDHNMMDYIGAVLNIIAGFKKG